MYLFTEGAVPCFYNVGLEAKMFPRIFQSQQPIDSGSHDGRGDSYQVSRPMNKDLQQIIPLYESSSFSKTTAVPSP